jgi:potassium channel subfamily K
VDSRTICLSTCPVIRIRLTRKLAREGEEERFRSANDHCRQWWFASTAIPLLAATIGPLANVLSIAALASKWRVTLPNNGQLPEGADDAGVDIPDPLWCTVLNAISLGVGVLGNLALMFNFTKRVRYIIALPLTIIAWYIATGIV